MSGLTLYIDRPAVFFDHAATDWHIG